jgi:peptidoglycan/xylan/chitin deacetylase (PgdA/CDA1 family)
MACVATTLGEFPRRAVSHEYRHDAVKSMSDSVVHRPSWRPSPLVAGSAALSLAAIAATAVRPHLWPWTLGAIVADHLLLTGVGLWPRSTLLGSNWTRLPEVAAAGGAVAITIDDGPDPEVTPRALALLEEYEAKATFFCVGERVQRHPDLAREIVRRGHTIENHTQRHVHNFSLLGPRGLMGEIGRAQESITAVVGSAPRFFRAPAGLRNPLLDPVLTRLGLQLASWTRRGFDTVTRDPDTVFNKLTRHMRGGDILLLHDGHAGRTHSGEPVILEVLPRLLTAVSAAKLRPITLRAALT